MKIRCPHCNRVNLDQTFCQRCGLDIRMKKSQSLQKSIAFLIAAIIFYLPANLYPILKTSKFFHSQESTILEGVMLMFTSGDYPVAIIIFVASVLIPFLKFFILFYLIITIYRGSCKGIKEKVKLYHLIELTGPWSLIDVFVVLILAALIHFKNIAIIPGIGVTSFALMVFFTILSSNALDPRIIGEDCEESKS